MNTIKVIVVDDSALMRKIISDMINSNQDMEVIATARNGEDLFYKLKSNSPDVITLDIEMPKMNGITTLKKLEEKNIRTPVIMLSSLTKAGAKMTMECLELGAFDFIQKPSGSISLDIEKVKDELIEKIRASQIRNKYIFIPKIKNNVKETVNKEKTHKKTINVVNNSKLLNTPPKITAVVIGASTGGPKALYKVVTKLPEDIGVPIFIVQHMPAGFTKAFADRLNLNSKIKVVEAENNQLIENNTVYIAPGGYHMEVLNDKRIHLNLEPSIWGVRPAVDKLFISASSVYRNELISAVLTGMGKDGAQGTIEVKKHGGITISEDESTCTIYGMPRAAYQTNMVDIVLPIDKIAENITKLVWGM